MHEHECAVCEKVYSCSGEGCAGLELGICPECDPPEEQKEGGSYVN